MRSWECQSTIETHDKCKQGSPCQTLLQAMVVICCMPWLADLAHEQLLVRLCTLLAAWPEPHAQDFVAALSRTTKQHMEDLVGSKLLQVSICCRFSDCPVSHQTMCWTAAELRMGPKYHEA